MSRMPLHLLPGFVAAARHGNLSRAADSLHVTVSALSHQMRQLEDALGYPLFLRRPRGVELTVEGDRLLESVAPHLEALERALRPCCRCDDALTLSLLPSMASSWLVPRLPTFMARYPEFELSLQSTTTLVDFARDPVDAALRFGPGQWPGLEADFLFDEWITPVASPELLASRGTPTLEDLGKWPLLGDPAGRWDDWFRRFGGTPPARYVARFGDTESLHRGAAEGIGIALARLTLARPLIEAGRLVCFSRERMKAEWGHYLVFPERSRGHRGLQAFRGWVREQAEAFVAAAA